MENVIGIDLGGTSIQGGRIEEGTVVDNFKLATYGAVGGDKTLGVLKEVISGLITDDTRAIGVGVPSIVDREKGIAYNFQNISGWEELHLKSILEDEFGKPVYIDNDANCFAYGEKIYGKGKEFSEFVGVTLGTGLGAGIVQGNRLMTDANGGSGEFGEIPYNGSKLEDYCGSRFFANTPFGSGFVMAQAALGGDANAKKYFEEFGRHLSHLVKIIVLVLDPQAIIFGGSIAKSFDLFCDAIIGNLSDFPYPKSIAKLKILASDQKDSGILGAASLCMKPSCNK